MKNILLSLFISAAPVVLIAQKLDYKVSFPNLAHHEAQIELTVSGAGQPTLIFRMSRSSPGRYATHEYGKNVYDVKAFDQSGKSVLVTRLDGDMYEVPNPKGFAKLVYTLYANHPDGTYAGIDSDGTQLNMPASFMWVKGLEKSPMQVSVELPEGKNWKIATQLNPGKEPNTFSAPDLQYFMDSPMKIGALRFREWKIGQQPYNFRLALDAEGSDEMVTSFADMLKKVTEEAGQIFKEYPAFENNEYTFLTSINPYIKGDGMEHRNSTVIHRPGEFTGKSNILGVFAHEFFHAWNVERIRPKTLEPFNYEKSNMSFELWFAEGFTQYYGELILKRANFNTLEDYVNMLTYLVNTKENTGGAHRFSPAEASCMAVFVDAGTAIDKTNYPNIFTSYYSYGAAIALALDIELRDQGKSLDMYMQAVWAKHGKREQPYTIKDLEAVLAATTGDPKFAASFFQKYINGHESFDYGNLLAKSGFTLSQPLIGTAWLGDVLWKGTEGLVISGNTIAGTPIYQAGLDIDDEVLKLDGRAVRTVSALQEVLAGHKPGDVIELEYKHRKEPKMTSVKLVGNPRYMVVPNTNATKEMLKFRADWLDSKL